MSSTRRDVDQLSNSVAAGSVANTTYTYYIGMDSFISCDFGFAWTPGSGGGAVEVVFYGTQEQGAVTGLNYEDITSDLFGVSTLSDDFTLIDDVLECGHYSTLKVTVKVTNKDADTTFTLLANRKA